ncbi:hypothetical protein R6Z07F_005198 [Ovis aries]
MAVEGRLTKEKMIDTASLFKQRRRSLVAAPGAAPPRLASSALRQTSSPNGRGAGEGPGQRGRPAGVLIPGAARTRAPLLRSPDLPGSSPGKAGESSKTQLLGTHPEHHSDAIFLGIYATGRMPPLNLLNWRRWRRGTEKLGQGTGELRGK